MSFDVVRLAPELVEESSAFPPTQEGFIMPHLLRYLRHVETLPAIDVTIHQGGIVVSRGHDYLAAAKSLKRDSIRAVTRDVDRLVNLVGPEAVQILSVPELHAEEEAMAVQREAWHVFFFHRNPRASIVLRFAQELVVFLEESIPNYLGRPADVDVVTIETEVAALEMRFATPCGNEEWISLFLECLHRLHKDMVPIVSYQGRRFLRK